ncbi:MAG: kelch repeat-containing protein [Candidatus Methanoperedens sp.]
MNTNKLIFAILLFTIASGQAFAAGDIWATKSAMPTARSDLHAASTGGLLYVAGGNIGPSGATNTVEAYNPVTDTWATLAPIPHPVYQGTIGVIDGKLYVVGGWDYPISGIPTRTLQIYNPVSNTWSTGADMPILSGCSIAGAINRKLYVLTACDGYSGFRKYLHVYDPDSNSWTAKASPPNTHAYAGGGVIDGKFYVIGGFDGSSKIATLDVYDPATDTWATKASMPTARQSLASGVVNGKLYAVGGSDGTKSLSALEVYDPVTDTWTTRASMTTARSSLAADVIDGKLYAVGGSDGTKVLATLEVFSSIVTPTTVPPTTIIPTTVPPTTVPPTTVPPTVIPTTVPPTTVPPTTASPPAKFRVGPSVTLRPVTDVIDTNQDGIVELFMNNPSLNDVTLNVDARISVPSGIHVYGQSFGEAAGAGVVAGTFSVPPGTSRTISVTIKADKSARIGSHTLQFTGLYYPGDNKDNYQPLSLTYSVTVKSASKEIPEPAAQTTSTPKAPGFEMLQVIITVGMAVLLIRRKK